MTIVFKEYSEGIRGAVDIDLLTGTSKPLDVYFDYDGTLASPKIDMWFKRVSKKIGIDRALRKYVNPSRWDIMLPLNEKRMMEALVLKQHGHTLRIFTNRFAAQYDNMIQNLGGYKDLFDDVIMGAGSKSKFSLGVAMYYENEPKYNQVLAKSIRSKTFQFVNQDVEKFSGKPLKLTKNLYGSVKKLPRLISLAHLMEAQKLGLISDLLPSAELGNKIHISNVFAAESSYQAIQNKIISAADEIAPRISKKLKSGFGIRSVLYSGEPFMLMQKDIYQQTFKGVDNKYLLDFIGKKGLSVRKIIVSSRTHTESIERTKKIANMFITRRTKMQGEVVKVLTVREQTKRLIGWMTKNVKHPLIAAPVIGILAGMGISYGAEKAFTTAAKVTNYMTAAQEQSKALELNSIGYGFSQPGAATERQELMKSLMGSKLGGRRNFGKEAKLYASLI